MDIPKWVLKQRIVNPDKITVSEYQCPKCGLKITVVNDKTPPTFCACCESELGFEIKAYEK